MRKKHKNEIYSIISDSEFDQNEFEFVESDIEEDELPTNKLLYKNSPFIFTIRTSRENFNLFDYQYVQYCPDYSMTDFFPKRDYTSFEIVANSLRAWLKNHIKEYIEDKTEPDLWSELQNGNKSFEINKIDFDNKDSFTANERNQVTMALNELKILISKNFRTSEEEQKLVTDRLDYLIDSSDRLNKFDWKSLAISTLLSISLSLTLDTTKGKILFELFRKVFSNIPLLD